MSGPRITDAAVEAAIEEHHAQYDDLYPQTPPWLMQMLKRDLTAALPHIRRAVIEELVEKYAAELRATASLHYIERGSYLAAAVRKLRAELEGGGE